MKDDTTHSTIAQPEAETAVYLFDDWFDPIEACVRERVRELSSGGEAAKLPFPIHPHMLRHSTGYKLADDGHDTRALQHYMGHKNIVHTVRYTEMAPNRFKDFWKD